MVKPHCFYLSLFPVLNGFLVFLGQLCGKRLHCDFQIFILLDGLCSFDYCSYSRPLFMWLSLLFMSLPVRFPKGLKRAFPQMERQNPTSSHLVGFCRSCWNSHIFLAIGIIAYVKSIYKYTNYYQKSAEAQLSPDANVIFFIFTLSLSKS